MTEPRPPQTLDANQVRQLFEALDSIRSLTEHLCHANFEVPYQLVYGAVAAETVIRQTLLRAAVGPVAIESPTTKESA
jgi:hypothetical protein